MKLFLICYCLKKLLIIEIPLGKTLKQASCSARLKMNKLWVLNSRRKSRSFRYEIERLRDFDQIQITKNSD